MLVPDIAVNIVKQFEGLRLDKYIDAAGYPTIGYGHKLTNPNEFHTITEEQAIELLQQDLQISLQSVLKLTHIALNNSQLSALIDFVYNLGSGTYQHSTLRQKLNRGEYIDAADEFKKWIYAGPRKLPGLIRRRKIEEDLFRSSS